MPPSPFESVSGLAALANAAEYDESWRDEGCGCGVVAAAMLWNPAEKGLDARCVDVHANARGLSELATAAAAAVDCTEAPEDLACGRSLFAAAEDRGLCARADCGMLP